MKKREIIIAQGEYKGSVWSRVQIALRLLLQNKLELTTHWEIVKYIAT